MPNPFSKLINPRYPSTAIGIEKGLASMVQLEQGRGGACTLRRAAVVTLPDSLVRPSFDEPNIADASELASALTDLATSAGLLQQKRWSVALPDTASRAQILTLDAQPGSSIELEEVLAWKIERGFGAPLEELSVSKERLLANSQGRDRYLVVVARTSILHEYESVLTSLGWRAGLMLPRNIAEAQWLTMNGAEGDALLLSSSDQGFTAAVFRGTQPLIMRTVRCGPQECEDELYRLLLFYRDRRGGEIDQGGQPLSRLLVIGDLPNRERAREIVSETLDIDLSALEAEDLGLQLTTRELSFDVIAAPAGLSTLSWQ